MKLFELKSTIDWEWKDVQSTSASAEFVVNGNPYVVSFIKYQTRDTSSMLSLNLIDMLPPTAWSIQFTAGPGFGVKHATGTGGEMQVFATIMEITKQFIEKLNPQAVEFSSSTKEPSREPLYRRLLKMFGQQGWKTTIVNDDEVGAIIYLAWK